MKFNFFTTGKPLAESEARRVFKKDIGHGVRRGTWQWAWTQFVRNVVEIHGAKWCGNLSVTEIWSTSCGPSRKSKQALSDLRPYLPTLINR